VNTDQGNQWFQDEIDISVVANDFEVKREREEKRNVCLILFKNILF
jgi:hypothetical protein